MGIFLNTNVTALVAQRNISMNSLRLDRTYQRLSSGIRINVAGDDAAGMAISERFTTQIRGLGQAMRNANDAISVAQVAEGALEESTNIVQRMRELAVQAANDTNTDDDRNAIQAELDQLVLELDRIGTTTRFNSLQILDGSFAAVSFHIGAFANELANVGIRDARAITIGRQATFTGVNVPVNALAAGDIVLNGVAIRATQPADDPDSTANADGSAIAKARAINDSTAATGVTAKVLPAVLTFPNPIGGGLLNGPDNLIINGETISSLTVAADDAGGGLVRAINEVFDRTGVSASYDVNHRLVLTAEDGRNIDVQVNGAGGVITGLPAATVQTGALNLYSDNAWTLAGANDAFIGMPVGHNELVTSVESVATVDVTTRRTANDSLLKLDRALKELATDRAGLGAFINRLQSTLSNLSNTVENSSLARSRILDTDFAAESSALAKGQIIEQAGISVLGQANQSAKQVISLLQNG